MTQPKTRREGQHSTVRFRQIRRFAPLLVPLIVGFFVAILPLRLYWGHWFAPPSAETSASYLAQMEHFTTIGIEPQLTGADVMPMASSSPVKQELAGNEALVKAAQNVNYTPGEHPLARLPAALVARGLAPQSPEPVPAQLLANIIATLDEAGQLKKGTPEYADTAELFGHIATGRSATGEQIVVAALSGQQYSNDHYPYYEGVFVVVPNDRLELRQLTFYWYDVAGIEGISHWLAGLAAAFITLVIWSIMALAHLAANAYRRRSLA